MRQATVMQESSIETVLVAQCAALGTTKTICPSDAAKALAALRGETGLAWQHWLMPVRRAAVAMALAGTLVIYRKGKPVDPQDFRGVYRIGLPRSD